MVMSSVVHVAESHFLLSWLAGTDLIGSDQELASSELVTTTVIHSTVIDNRHSVSPFYDSATVRRVLPIF